MELFSILCASLDGRGVWGRMDTCICMAEFLCYLPETVKTWLMGFPSGSDSKASVCNAGDPGSIPGLGRSPEEGNGSPLQYSCQENPMDRGAR